MTVHAAIAPANSQSINRTPHRVLFADTDALGIVYYANYLKYFEVGRAEWFREFMLPATDYIADDLYFVVLESHCNYRRPAHYDDVLTIETRIGAVDRVRIRIDYRILDVDGKAYADGYTIHTVTGKNGRLRRFPKDFIDQMAAHVGTTD